MEASGSVVKCSTAVQPGSPSLQPTVEEETEMSQPSVWHHAWAQPQAEGVKYPATLLVDGHQLSGLA